MLGRIFARGLFTVLPLVITLGLLLWVFDFIEGAVGGIVAGIVGPDNYFKGEGILVFLVLIFIVGILMSMWFTQTLYQAGERLLKKIPLIKTLYGAVTDLMSFFSGDSSSQGSQVVIVEAFGHKVVGIVTQTNSSKLPPNEDGEEQVLVYLPMSYQIGGFSVLLPKKDLRPLDMTVEQGMRFAVTAGMSVTEKEQKDK